MKTFTNLLISAAVLVLMGGVFSVDAFGQQTVYYALDSGGSGTDCTVAEPCAFSQALTSASADDTIAVRVRRNGGRALITDAVILAASRNFAVYNEDYGDEDDRYLLDGELEFRGAITLGGAGSIRFGPYEDFDSQLTISSSAIGVQGASLDPDELEEDFPHDFFAYKDASSLRGNVVIGRNSTITVSGTECPTFENLQIASGVEVEVTGTCTAHLDALAFSEQDGFKVSVGINVWNVLDVDGTLMLDGFDLHLIAPRPNSMEDSMYAGVTYTEVDGELERGATNRSKWPRAEIDGMITSKSGIGTLYIQVQEEVLSDTTYMNIEQPARDADGRPIPNVTVDTLVTIMPSYFGWQNEWGHYYHIDGDGRIDLNVMKTTQAGVRLDVDFGTGASSANDGGRLYVYASDIDGDFENNGFAQTQFGGKVTISNSIVVTGPVLPEGDEAGRRGIGSFIEQGFDTGAIVRAVADFPNPVPMLECHNHADRLQGGSNTLYFGNDNEDGYDNPDTYPHMLGSRGLSTGIYFHSDGNVVSGAAELTGGVKRTGEYYEPGDMETLWSAGDDSTKVKFACYGGLLAFGSTTIRGDLIGDDVTHVLVNDNVMLEGDYFDVRNADEVVVRNTGIAAGLSDGDICKSTSVAPRSTGPHLVFTGSADQTVSGGRGSGVTLDGVGLRIDKGSTERVELNMMVSAKTVDLKGGLLTTNGMLDVSGGALYINQDPGSVGDIRRGSSDKAYAVVGGSTKGPGGLTYTGDLASMDTGDELYEGMGVGYLEMWLGTAATELTILSNIKIANQLYLSQGTLAIPSGVTLTAPGFVQVGNGYIDGDAAGTWRLYSSPVRYGLVQFKGKMDRSLSNILPSYSLAGAKSAEVAIVYVDGCPTHDGSNLIYDGGFTLSLQEGYTPVHTLHIRNRSKLDLAGNVLVARGDVNVGAEGWLCDSDGSAPCTDSEAYRDLLDLSDALEAVHYEDTPEARVDLARAQASYEGSRDAAAKAAAGDGAVYFYNKKVVARTGVPYHGATLTASLASNKKRLDWYMPHVVVGEFTHVEFEGGDTAPTTSAIVMPNMADKVMFPSIEFTAGGAKTIYTEYTGSRITFTDFDRVMVGGDVMTGGKSQLFVGASGGHPQAAFMVGGDLSVGGRLAMHGGVLAVTGDYSQSGDEGSAGGFASDVWLQKGAHYQMGDFYVGAGVNADTTHVYSLQAPDPAGDHGITCLGGTREIPYLGAMRMVNAGLMLQGDYAFHGAGDAYDATQTDVLGLRGTVTFVGNDTSLVSHSGAMNSFCNVAVQSDPSGSPGLVMMGSNVMQNKYGELTLKNGLVSSDNHYHTWMLANEAIEDTLVGRISIGAEEPGVVRYGSRDSYVDGYVSRSVSMGTQGGGVVTGGYLFPVGSANENGPDFYRPLILQFPADLGSARMATVGFMAGAVADSMDWPDDNLTVDGADGMLTLDNVADMFWKVTLDAVPAHDPNIRLAADELPNIFDIKGLRIVQWDCDGTNPRLAGVYDLDSDPIDDKSFQVNDFLNGIPNLTQEGVNVGTCNIFGVASNFLQNPISVPVITSGTSRVQFINNVAGATVDLYIDDNRVVDDFAFQTARAFGNIAAGTHRMDIVPANAPDNSVTLIPPVPVRFRQNMNYHVIAHGNAATGVVDFVIREDVRMASTTNNMVDFYFVHGAAGLGVVDIRLIDPIDNTRVLGLLANNFTFDDVGTYMSMDPGGYNFEVTTANNDTQIDVFRLEIQQYANLAFVLNLSGTGKSSADGVTMMGVAQDGNPFFPQVITGTENSELPTEFALLGNYPNPFNPSTRIEFDLPETAEVSIAVFDMLGRNVMTLPSKEFEAGANRSIELNAASLASGPYFYRVVATGASGRHIETGRMVLIK